MKSKTAFVYDDIFLKHKLGESHVESPARLEAILKRINATGIADKLLRLSPVSDMEVLKKAILSIHTKIHFDSIVKWEKKALPALLAVGGVLRAVDAVMGGEAENAFCAIRPPGHHAQNHGAHCDGRYQGEGFCFFNNVAVGARHAQNAHKAERILVIDWDYHHGNGTEAIFYDDPSVFYFSTHAQFDYPVTGSPDRDGNAKGRGYNLNVPLAYEAGDKEIIAAYRDVLIPRLAELKFTPELVMISAGFDSRENDLLGRFTVTDKGFLELTRIVKGIARDFCGGKIVSVLEGGYNLLGLSQAVAIHLRGLLNGDHKGK